MQAHTDARFQAQLASAIEKIKTILDNTRSPVCASQIGHSFEDKYSLAEFVTNSALASLVDTCEFLGFTKENILQMKKWSTTRSVTLRLQSVHKCSFLHKKDRKVDAPQQNVTSLRGIFSATSKVVTTVHDYFWKFESNYSLIAFKGSDNENPITLLEGNGECEIVISHSDAPPESEIVVNDPIDLNITWLLSQLSELLELTFTIDRSKENCNTPRRNEDISAAFLFFRDSFSWAQQIQAYFMKKLFSFQSHDLDSSAINNENIFVPVLPLLEKNVSIVPEVKKEEEEKVEESAPKTKGNKKEKRKGGKEESSVRISERPFSVSNAYAESEDMMMLPSSDILLFLDEQKRGLEEKRGFLQTSFPADKGLLTSSAATVVMVIMHIQSICQHFGDGIEFIENMLREQLIAAIGKEIGAKEFDEYMQFHYRKIFQSDYTPKPFSYAVRRPDRSPEGVVSIEYSNRGEVSQPIASMVKKMDDSLASVMNFPINGATKIRFGGERYIHAWISHQFSNDLSASLRCNARARQFSSFILMIGNVVSADSFQPKTAIIIQNKDDLLIPLLTDVIPTPKAFQKSVESLSETQRAFAKAFRAMQLESTLFSLCIVQIKPQLEKLLRIPEDSLTKEIRLTQDLMDLFIEYQIPSDLLSYEPQPGVKHTNAQKIEFVKKQVAAMNAFIQETKDEVIREATEKYELEIPSSESEIIEEEEFAIPELKYECSSFMDEEDDCYGGASNCIDYMDFESCKFSEDLLQCAESVDLMEEFPEPIPEPMPEPMPEPEPEPEPEVGEEPEEVESKEEEEEGEKEREMANEEVNGSPILDFTKLPAALNKSFEELDLDDALHATILKVEEIWTKKYQKALLAAPESRVMGEDDQQEETKKAYDLLDAITRSGGLLIDAASFHVVVASTHCFDHTLIDTVIKNNTNPIEQVERSALIVASTIHEESPETMIKPEHLERVKASSTSAHLFE